MREALDQQDKGPAEGFTSTLATTFQWEEQEVLQAAIS